MKYCKYCGQEMADDARYCPKCGAPQDQEQVVATPKVESTQQQPRKGMGEWNPLQIAAFVLMIITTVGVGWSIIPLAWCIPMTVSYYNKINNREKVSVGFKVCTIIFVNLIAGILMLVDNEE